jgi:hypothetical protein
LTIRRTRKSSPRKRLFRRIGIGALSLLFIWWIPLRRLYFEDGMRVSLKGIGVDGAVTFVVKGSGGAPVTGVDVMVETTSGIDGSGGITDEHGMVVYPVGETEIVSVWIDGSDCEFWKIPVIDDVFLPDCSSGLTVEAKLEQHP